MAPPHLGVGVDGRKETKDNQLVVENAWKQQRGGWGYRSDPSAPDWINFEIVDPLDMPFSGVKKQNKKH